jgi:hypothetical protein
MRRLGSKRFPITRILKFGNVKISISQRDVFGKKMKNIFKVKSGIFYKRKERRVNI